MFGGSHATMSPLEALYLFVDDAYTYSCFEDAEDLMCEYGYETYTEAKNVYKSLERAYFKCRKFIGDVDDIHEIVEELREKWG
jgi:hemerythrin